MRRIAVIVISLAALGGGATLVSAASNQLSPTSSAAKVQYKSAPTCTPGTHGHCK